MDGWMDGQTRPTHYALILYTIIIVYAWISCG